MKTLIPPEIDTKDVGRNPEDPLFPVKAGHEELADPIGRIGDTIPERTSTMDALISKAHTNPDHGTQGQVAHPLDQGQFLSFKVRFFRFSLIVNPIGEPDIKTDRLSISQAVCRPLLP